MLRHAGLGRPAGHADTPVDDQQAMLGLHQTNCFMLLLDDAQKRPKNRYIYIYIYIYIPLDLTDRAGQPAFQPGPKDNLVSNRMDLVRPGEAL